ncbi:MAG: N-acetyl sugar amidotransferase [Bacteroidia bacterium]
MTVMDTTDPAITFDADGVCNHVHLYRERYRNFVKTGEAGQRELERIADEVRKSGKGKDFDCLIGVSGGADSTYLCHLAKELDLRPLLVHLDNGWNSEAAVQNISNIVDRLGFDLYTHVIDWEEFKDLQLSFLKASVLDLELTSDHAIVAILYQMARKYKIDYSLNGFNVVTEGILPKAWRWAKLDWLNIKSIHDAYGKVKLRTFPRLPFLKKLYYDYAVNLKTYQPLNLIAYDKWKMRKVISEELGWRDYGGKHYESIITRFYQGYILPTKFNVDKRKAHLSTLICSGQITREEALRELEKPAYDPEQLAIDKEFVIKKLGLTASQFEEIMRQPVRPHDAFPTYETRHYVYHERFFRTLRPLTRSVKRIAGIRTTPAVKY